MKRFSKSVCDLLEEGVIMVSRKGKIFHANRAASKLLGLPQSELLKKRIGSLSHSLLDKGLEQLVQARKKGEVISESVNIDGKGFFELIAFAPTRRKGVILFRDRSNQRQVVEMGKAFVANASHELRTPITIIKGFAETLQDLPQISMELLSDITEKIVRNCQRMENLVKSLLTLSDLEMQVASSFQECDLCQLVESCRHLLFPLHPKASVELIADDPEVMILADPHIMELAIFNLLENAAKYSSGDPEIRVEITKQEDEVICKIQDKGIGMAPQDLKHIFERFYTVNKARSRKLGGAGIGLSIVKTIMQKHNGSIAVESKLGEGTAFTLKLPILQS